MKPARLARGLYKTLKWLFLATLILALIAGGALYWLLGSDNGYRRLPGLINHLTPYTLEYDTLEGRLLGEQRWHNLHLHGAGRHDGFAQQHPVLGHRQPAHVHGRLAARYVQPLVERVEPDVRHVQQVVARPDAHQVEAPLAVRDGALHHRAVLDVQQPHGRHLHTLGRLARADDGALDVDLRHHSSGSPQQQEAQKKDRKSLYHRLFTSKSCAHPRRLSPESGAIDVIRGRWFKLCFGRKMR